MPGQPRRPRALCATGPSLLPASLGAPGSHRSPASPSRVQACLGLTVRRAESVWGPPRPRLRGAHSHSGLAGCGPGGASMSPSRSHRSPLSRGLGWNSRGEPGCRGRSGQGDLPRAPGSLTGALGHGAGGEPEPAGPPWLWGTLGPPARLRAGSWKTQQAAHGADSGGRRGGRAAEPSQGGLSCPCRASPSGLCRKPQGAKLGPGVRRPRVGAGHGQPPHSLATNPGPAAPPPSRRTALCLVL